MRSIMDVGALRLPFRGWYVHGTGDDMELNGAVPDHVLWPKPGQLPAGQDVQLSRAVELLKADVAKADLKKESELRKASQR